MKIKEYQSEDAFEMFQLFTDTVQAINSQDYNSEQIAAWLSTSNFEVWKQSFQCSYSLVTKQQNRIVGFADIDKNGCIDRLYVHKDYQGVGIATALVKKLEKHAKLLGLKNITTYASITAKPFFLKRGYIVQFENIVLKNGTALVNFKMNKHI